MTFLHFLYTLHHARPPCLLLSPPTPAELGICKIGAPCHSPEEVHQSGRAALTMTQTSPICLASHPQICPCTCGYSSFFSSSLSRLSRLSFPSLAMPFSRHYMCSALRVGPTGHSAQWQCPGVTEVAGLDRLHVKMQIRRSADPQIPFPAYTPLTCDCFSGKDPLTYDMPYHVRQLN